jgi:hypothetical protein
MKLNWKKLYEHLDSLRAGESWRTLATRHGVTPSIFTRISQGKPTSVRNLLKLLAMQDKSIDHYTDKKGTK